MGANIGWWDVGNRDNDYLGSDGGSYIRIPLLRELTNRGHTVYAEFPDPGNYGKDGTTVLDELGIKHESLRYRQRLTEIIEIDFLERVIDRLDVLVVEARKSGFEHFARQRDIVEQGRENNIPVFVFDRNNWAQHHPVGDLLLRPYVQENEYWDQEQVFFPYWRSDVPKSEIEPQYDLVYVGNRYGREEQMDRFLDGLEDLDILVAGNWPDRDQEVTSKYDFDFIGSTPHYSTIPLLKLGKATFHVGKPDYNDLGMVTMRPFEAAMANRVCFISDDVDILGTAIKGKFHTSNEKYIREMLSGLPNAAMQRQFQRSLNTVDKAARRLETLINAFQ